MRKSIGLLASAGFAVLPVIGHAATPTLSDVLTASGITENGYIDAGYSAATNLGSNSFNLSQAAITVAKQPTEGVGGLVTLIGGSNGGAASAVNAAYGDSEANFSLAQAYVQYATGALTVIGGRYFTLAGAEVIDPTQDANITRSLLFTDVQPLVHTGVRATYKINDQLSVMGGLNNTAFDPTGGTEKPQKTIELGATFAPISSLTTALSYYHEAGDTVPGTVGRTDLVDVVATFQATSIWSVGLNGDYRHAADISGTPGTSGTLKGIALYSSLQLASSLKGSLRAEYVDNIGVPAPFYNGTATSGSAKEITGTLDYSVAKNFDVLGEARFDKDSSAVFATAATPPVAKANATTLSVSAIYKF